MKTILVSVVGGIAEAVTETVPSNTRIEIVDIDNFMDASDTDRKDMFEGLSLRGKNFVRRNWNELVTW